MAARHHDGDSSSSEPEGDGAIGPPYNPAAGPTAAMEEVLLVGDSAHSPDSDQAAEDIQAPATMTTRAYQQEMLEASLERNIIVAMDTGTGKTQIAVLRMQAELERNDKLVWFLATTVALASQQFDVVQSQIPWAQSKFLCGADGVDTWSTTKIWDAVLSNVRIVVSTYQILADAVKHGFVRLDSLALIVFDEAHNCLGDSAGSRLMKEHYWPAKLGNRSIPRILGLTASPVIRAGARGLETLETTLDSICRTPTRHRDELLTHVNRPEMFLTSYESPGLLPRPDDLPPNMSGLAKAYGDMDINKDPLILRLRAENTARSRDRLRKAIMTGTTDSQRFMKSFYRKSAGIWQQLGPWAADYYINIVIAAITAKLESATDLSDAELAYLTDTLKRIPLQATPAELQDLSEKVRKLLRILVSFPEEPVGIVFVKERAMVAVLAHILSNHPSTQARYRVGTMVGTSAFTGGKRLAGLLDLVGKQSTDFLEGFRSGDINLLVTTDVLEEGIDVPACNLVVCFDKPSVLKSFIQRRGRARMRASQLHLLVEAASMQAAVEWQQQEVAMKLMYEDEVRELQHIRETEDSEDMEFPPLQVPSTGARLTVDDAKSHLEHFCQTLTSRKFVDTRPYYIVRGASDTEPGSAAAPGEPMLRVTVHLPTSLPPELRRAESSRPWLSERNACKDAAFQAYSALYRAGLLNDHLLPLRGWEALRGIETRPGLADVREQMDPWPDVAAAWKSTSRLYRRSLAFEAADGSGQTRFQLVLPVPIPEIQRLTLYWDSESAWSVDFAELPPRPSTPDPSSPVAPQIRDDTGILLALAYGHRWPVLQEGHIARFMSEAGALDLRGIGSRELSAADHGTRTPGYLLRDTLSSYYPYLLRDTLNSYYPYFYTSRLPSKPPLDQVRRPFRGYEEAPADVPYVVVRGWPKRAGFLRQPAQQHPPASTEPYHLVLPESQVKVDDIPVVYARFGMLLPSILHTLEVHLVATELLTTRLSGLGLTDLSLVVTAISTPAAREPTDYERLEFLGDSILKLCVTGDCLAKHPDWPEGHLSPLRDHFVANWRLFCAAREFGLDRFVVSKGVTLHGWRPRYVSDYTEAAAAPPDAAAAGTRRMSTKTIADVVEALIGAAYVSAGLPGALGCIARFFPEQEWRTLEDAWTALATAVPAGAALPPTLEPLEGLVGHAFRRKALLAEAVTHQSYAGPDAGGCLERLEFLGDAVLDHVVVRGLSALDDPPLPNHAMHLLRTALVNGDFLGFLAMEWAAPLARVDASAGGELAARPADVALWQFMRFSSAALAAAQRATRERHAELRGPIREALRTGARYPWALLARLHAEKFYSDVFEAVLGAVWVDSGGSLGACEAVLERAGLLPRLRRLLADKVNVLHPREELGRLAGSEKVTYALKVTLGPVGCEVACRVTIGDVCEVAVAGCLNKEEALTRAAEAAVERYRSLGGRWTVTGEEEDSPGTRD